MTIKSRLETKKDNLSDTVEFMKKDDSVKQNIDIALQTGTNAGRTSVTKLDKFTFISRNDGNINLFGVNATRGISKDQGNTFKYISKIDMPGEMSMSKLNIKEVQGSYIGYNDVAAGYIRMKDGRIGMTYTKVYQAGENQSILNMYFRVSENEGETWSEPVKINTGADKGAPMSGTLRQLRSGRLIQPVRWCFFGGDHLRVLSVAHVNGKIVQHEGHGHHPEIEVAYCYYSDDNGITWGRSKGEIIGWFLDGWGNFLTIDEPVVEQLKDGNLIMMSRSLIGRLMVCFSQDEGTTWSIPEPTDIVSDGAPCNMIKIPSTGDILLVWNQQDPNEIRRGLRRCRLSSAVSRDGRIWEHFRSIDWSPCVDERPERIKPESKIQLTRALDDIGELPTPYICISYPILSTMGDEIVIGYSWSGQYLDDNGKSPNKSGENRVSCNKYKILPSKWFYE